MYIAAGCQTVHLCFIRPQNQLERDKGGEACAHCKEDGCSVQIGVCSRPRPSCLAMFRITSISELPVCLKAFSTEDRVWGQDFSSTFDCAFDEQTTQQEVTDRTKNFSRGRGWTPQL